jgi:hypothetical protein
MSNLDREPFIDAPYHVLVQLAKRFQGRRFLEIDQSAIRNKSCLWWPCLLTDQNKVSNLYRGPSIDASYRVSADMAKTFQSRFFFKNLPNHCRWRPCLLTDRDEMCILYRGPSIDASYHVSVHLAKQFQRIRIFRHRSIRNKNCLWQPRLLTDQDKMSILYREPSIDTFNQVSVHLAKWL